MAPQTPPSSGAVPLLLPPIESHRRRVRAPLTEPSSLLGSYLPPLSSSRRVTLDALTEMAPLTGREQPSVDLLFNLGPGTGLPRHHSLTQRAQKRAAVAAPFCLSHITRELSEWTAATTQISRDGFVAAMGSLEVPAALASDAFFELQRRSGGVCLTLPFVVRVLSSTIYRAAQEGADDASPPMLARCFELMSSSPFAKKIDKAELDAMRLARTLTKGRTRSMVLAVLRLIATRQRAENDPRKFVTRDEFVAAMADDADPVAPQLVAAFLPLFLRSLCSSPSSATG